MNVINIVIISVALVSLAVIIVIITKSFKDVDEKIVDNIALGNDEHKINFVKKIKQVGLLFTEWFIKIIKNGSKKIHYWVVKERIKNKNEIIKAQEELIIGEDERLKFNDGQIKEEILVDEENTIKEIYKNEGKDIVKEILEEDTRIVIDSVKPVDTKKGDKQNFLVGLFKNKKKKKDIDFKRNNIDISEGWSLDRSVSIDDKEKADKVLIEQDLENGSGEKTESVDNELDIKCKVNIENDRKILEEKILQKIDKDPKSLNNYHELGELYIKMKKYKDALEVFHYVLNVAPNDTKARRRQDKIMLLQKLYTQK